jgi:hypothetical protein
MRRRSFITAFILLLASCGGKETAVEPAQPAIRITLEEVTAFQARLTLNTIDCSKVRYGVTGETDRQLDVPSTGAERLPLLLDDLLPEQDYVLRMQGIGPDGEEGKMESVRFRSTEGPSSGLYDWEKTRDRIPCPADMTLIPGPSSHRKPLEWTTDRWRKHVSYVDENGTEHWLFDSFLLIEGQQNGVYGETPWTYVLTASYARSANKELWQNLLDFWFTGGTFPWQESYWGDGVNSFGRWYTGETEYRRFERGQLDALEACIDEVAGRIGPPPGKRYVIMALPEPVYFDNYIAAVQDPGSARTAYWGSLEGQTLDFADVEQRIRACQWFMDETRAAFHRKQYRNIELLGFYILPEELDLNWRAQYKQYDVLVPAVAEYAHACNEALFWIPYNLAPGYQKWEEFGIDLAYMQPNYYWEPDKKPMATTFREIGRYRMGLELEFEYSMVENVNGAQSARTYRQRFDEYLEWARSSGVYGNRSIALYSGTDALQQLADSPLPDDRATYHKLGHFLIESPLKNKNLSF